MIKLIASDVDGTLVPDGTFEICPDIYDVIRQLKERNITFVVASGRQYASIRKLFSPVADDILYIVDNGGFVRDSKGNTWQKKPMDKSLVKALTEDAAKIQDADVMLCGRDYAYVKNEDSYLFRWMRDSYRYEIRARQDLTGVEDDIVKVSVYHPENAENAVKEWFYDKWKGEVLIASAGVNWIDCVLYDANKGTALQFIMDKLGITREEVMVFGDNINDLGMLSCAAESYAIGSARNEVKQAAAHVADTLENQGVIKTIREEILAK